MSEIRDIRNKIIENGDLCIRTSFADKKSVLVYCVVFDNRAFYIKPNWRTSRNDLMADITCESSVITSFTFEDYQIMKLNELDDDEKAIRERLLGKLANFNGKGNFSVKYIEMAKRLLN